MSRKIVRILDLIDDADLITQYRKYHAPERVWPSVVDHIRAEGVLSMEIWHIGDRLVMTAEVTADYPRAVTPPLLINTWEDSMDRFQRRLAFAFAGVKWVDAEQIFSLAEQIGD